MSHLLLGVPAIPRAHGAVPTPQPCFAVVVAAGQGEAGMEARAGGQIVLGRRSLWYAQRPWSPPR